MIKMRSTNNSSQSLTAGDQEVSNKKQEIKNLQERMEKVYIEYQDVHGNFDASKPEPNEQALRPPPKSSKFTKAYSNALNKRCEKLDGKLSTHRTEKPNTAPTEEHLKEFNELDAEVYVLEKEWKCMKEAGATLEKVREGQGMSK